MNILLNFLSFVE